MTLNADELAPHISTQWAGAAGAHYQNWCLLARITAHSDKHVTLNMYELAESLVEKFDITPRGEYLNPPEPAVQSTPDLSMDDWRVISESLKAAGHTTLANRIDVWRI